MKVTLHSEDDSLADGGWNAVTGDAQVFANVGPRGRRKGQRISVNRRHFAAVVSDHGSILAFPHDFRPRRSLSIAGQIDWTSLLDHFVFGGSSVNDGGRDHHL